MRVKSLFSRSKGRELNPPLGTMVAAGELAMPESCATLVLCSAVLRHGEFPNINLYCRTATLPPSHGSVLLNPGDFIIFAQT